MVHDYYSNRYKSVKSAVHNFAKEQPIRYVTLPDTSGSVVITKP